MTQRHSASEACATLSIAEYAQLEDDVAGSLAPYRSSGSSADPSLISAPIRATTVKRAYGSGPVATSCRPGWADCSSGSFLAGAGVVSPRGQGSGWSARSRAAARTNELDAGKRREILESGEGLVGIGL